MADISACLFLFLFLHFLYSHQVAFFSSTLDIALTPPLVPLLWLHSGVLHYPLLWRHMIAH